MNSPDVDAFLEKIKASLKRYFSNYKIEFLIKTPRSLKANIFLESNLFIAVRYNARNKRMDFALILDDLRIFGYDNLKEWHYHPFGRESDHIPCEKPSIEKIIYEINEVYNSVKK